MQLAQQAGCSFSVNFRAPFGAMNAALSPADIAACILDGVNLPARLTGPTPDEYAEWIEQDGLVRCCAKTRAGRQCRNFAPGGGITDPAEWKAFRATAPYCHTHDK